jgi:hypothetical protein
MTAMIGIEGASVAMLFGQPGRPRSAVDRRFRCANDNGPKDPVHTVTVRKTLEKSGVVIKVKVPVTEFSGVAVATQISGEGVLTSTLELVHADPALNYQVFAEEGNFNIVAEWQNWGRKLRLPLYIKAGDGSLVPYSQQVDGLLLGQSSQRRRLAVEVERRPRFLNRRKPGQHD